MSYELALRANHSILTHYSLFLFVPSDIATIELMLRRTLQRPVILLSFLAPDS